MTAWNPELYQHGHSFVWELGRDLLPLLAPRPGERVLDIGCGTGQLTAEIARAGAQVAGIDLSEAMIAEARRNYPSLQFDVIDATALPYRAEFDAVFSNAALHWIRDAEAVAAGVCRALKPGGRFVAEFGGRGNVRRLLEAAFAALRALGAEPHNPWYFPSIGEYAGVLEKHGLAVTYAVLFDRPTRLEGGSEALANWFHMFGQSFIAGLEPAQREEFLRRVEEHLARELLKHGVWTVDYCRLRIRAVAAGASTLPV